MSLILFVYLHLPSLFLSIVFTIIVTIIPVRSCTFFIASLLDKVLLLLEFTLQRLDLLLVLLQQGLGVRLGVDLGRLLYLLRSPCKFQGR